MADTVRIIAGTAVVWGTSGCTIGTGTIVSDCTIGQEGETKAIPNNNGNTAEVVQFDDRKSGSITILKISTATDPKRGDIIAIGDKGSFLVEKVSDAYKRGEEAYITIDFNSWENVSLTPPGGGA